MGIWDNEFPPWGTWFTCRAGICGSAFHPALSLLLGAISVMCVCDCQIMFHLTTALIVFALTQVPARMNGQAQSTAMKSKWAFQIYYVSYLNLHPGICKWEVTKMYFKPFISYSFYIAWLLSDEITLKWMKRQMLTEPSLALLLDYLQEIRVASWLWKHPFRLSLCLPALSCHM